MDFFPRRNAWNFRADEIRCFSRTRSTPSSLTRLSPGDESLTSSISRLQNTWNQGG